MKRCQKFGQGPPLPDLDKIQKNSSFFRGCCPLAGVHRVYRLTHTLSGVGTNRNKKEVFMVVFIQSRVPKMFSMASVFSSRKYRLHCVCIWRDYEEQHSQAKFSLSRVNLRLFQDSLVTSPVPSSVIVMFGFSMRLLCTVGMSSKLLEELPSSISSSSSG